jgi:phage terminase large subunit
MELNLQATPIFQKNYQAKTRVILNVGSSRSSKTYSLLQVLIVKALEEKKSCVYTIARKTLPALKASAYRDFLEILTNENVYKEHHHNKSDLTYQIGNTLFEFISVDQPDKVKGRKRKTLYINEANELNYQDFTQLALRTTDQIFLDLNPSHATDHWIEEKIKTRDDLTVIHSTYKDNPFLDKQTIFEIERLKNTDPNLWRIYGLGELGISEARIFTHFQLCDSLPEVYNRRSFGLDFGYNHPTALVEVREVDDRYYAKELIYEKGLLNIDLIKRLEALNIPKEDIIYCDYSRPEHIKEIHDAGFNAQNADKAVDKGLDTVKSKEVFVTKDSVNMIKESNSYSYKVTGDGKVLEDPVKVFDDAMDSLRYAIHSMQVEEFVGFA